MSMKLTAMVWELELPQTETLVMLSLADFSDDNGFSWPSKATLAKRSRVSKRTVDKYTNKLAVDGWLNIQMRQGKNVFNSNGYQLNLEKINRALIEQSKLTGGSANLAGGVVQTSQGVVQHSLQGGSASHAAPELSLNGHKKDTQQKKAATPHSNSKTPQTISEHAWFTKWWCHAFALITGTGYAYSKKSAGLIKNLIKQIGLDELVARTCAYLTIPEGQRFPRGAPTLEGLQYMINQIADAVTPEVGDKCRTMRIIPTDDTPLVEFYPWQETADKKEVAQ